MTHNQKQMRDILLGWVARLRTTEQPTPVVENVIREMEDVARELAEGRG